MADVLTWEHANLFCGDHDPLSSLHLVLSSIKLPNLEENYGDFTGGGVPIGIEADTHIMKLVAGFNLLGWNPRVMTLMGESRRERQVFTIYAVVRDRMTGKALEGMAVIQGRLGKANPQEFAKGTNQLWEHSINGIYHYECYLDSNELMYWDYFTSERRVGGVDLNDDINRILRIPKGSGTPPVTQTPDSGSVAAPLP